MTLDVARRRQNSAVCICNLDIGLGFRFLPTLCGSGMYGFSDSAEGFDKLSSLCPEGSHTLYLLIQQFGSSNRGISFGGIDCMLRTFQIHDSSDGITPGNTHLGNVIMRSIASSCKLAGGKDQHRFRKV